MKKIVLFCLVLSASHVFAQKNYIKGIQKVTFRKEAGKTQKIIKMLPTESPVTIIEAGEEWTKVKDSEGVEGYVLNRFLTKDVPFSLKYKWLKGRYDKEKEKSAQLAQDLKELKTELSGTKASLKETETSLKQTSDSFEDLKSGSADYLNLKKKFERTEQLLLSQTAKVKELESKVSTIYIFWFLAGGGVLFVGWLIGLISRKKKKYGSSLSF